MGCITVISVTAIHIAAQCTAADCYCITVCIIRVIGRPAAAIVSSGIAAGRYTAIHVTCFICCDSECIIRCASRICHRRSKSHAPHQGSRYPQGHRSHSKGTRTASFGIAFCQLAGHYVTMFCLAPHNFVNFVHLLAPPLNFSSVIKIKIDNR